MRLVDSHGHLASVAVGDHVTAHSLSSDADWIVPDIQASGNPANDVVSGVCEQTGSVSDLGHVDVVRPGHVRGRAYVGLDATGHFSWDFGGQPSPGFDPANIKHGDKLVVGCMIDTGDWVQRSFMVP